MENANAAFVHMVIDRCSILAKDGAFFEEVSNSHEYVLIASLLSFYIFLADCQGLLRQTT